MKPCLFVLIPDVWSKRVVWYTCTVDMYVGQNIRGWTLEHDYFTHNEVQCKQQPRIYKPQTTNWLNIAEWIFWPPKNYLLYGTSYWATEYIFDLICTSCEFIRWSYLSPLIRTQPGTFANIEDLIMTIGLKINQQLTPIFSKSGSVHWII